MKTRNKTESTMSRGELITELCTAISIDNNIFLNEQLTY